MREAGESLMERAQRRKFAEEDMMMRRENHAASMVTTDLQQQSTRAEINVRQAQFRETERNTRELADLRSEYNARAPQIDIALREIQDMRDPFQQRRLISQLIAQSAKFTRDPALKTVLDRQMEGTMKLIDANEASKLSEYLDTGQFAVNEADAKMKFPGQALRVVTRPGPVPGGPAAVYYLPTGKADPQAENQAFGLLRSAQALGDMGMLQSILNDPEVQKVMRVPGSTFAAEYAKAMQSAVELNRKREADKRASEDQDFQRAQFKLKQDALTVEGYEGTAKTEIEAQKFRSDQKEIGGVLEGIAEVKRLGKEFESVSWTSDPLKKEELRSIAKQQVGMIVGALRIPITGPGAMTDSEREFIEDLNGNPTKIFSLSKVENAKLDSMERKFNSHLDRSAAVIGLGPRKKKPGTAVSGQRAQALIRGN
ncbi:MAG: hypothetical protein ACO3EH_00465 [Ilumatobacteraceae bacterium]